MFLCFNKDEKVIRTIEKIYDKSLNLSTLYSATVAISVIIVYSYIL